MLRVGQIGLVLMVTYVLVGCSSKEDQQAAYVEQAWQYLEAEDFRRAAIDAQNAIDIADTSAEARYLLAILEEKRRAWPAAIDQLKRALQIDPNYSDAYLKLSQLLFIQRNLAEAKRYAEQSLELLPKSPKPLAMLALITNQEGDQTGAIALANQALDLDPGSEDALSVLIDIYQKTDLNQALAVINTGISNNPSSENLKLIKVQVLDRLGQQDQAVAVLEQLVADSQDNERHVVSLAQYYVGLGLVDKADALLQKTLSQKPDQTQLKLIYAQFLSEQKSNNKAIEQLQQWLEQDANNFDIRLALGQLLATDNQAERAKALFEEALQLHQGGQQALISRVTLAEIALAEQDFTTANSLIDEVIAASPANDQAVVTKAKILLAERKYNQALAELRNVLNRNANLVPALLLQAEAYVNQGEADLALKSFEKVLAAQPNNVPALFNMAALLAQAKSYDRAETLVNKLIEAEPKNLRAVNLLAEIQANKGKWQEVKPLFSRFENTPQASQANMAYGALALENKHFDEAVNAAKQALVNGGNPANAVQLAVQGFVNNNKPKEALAFVEETRANLPEQSQPIFNDVLIRLYVVNKKHSQAISLLKQKLQVNSQDIQAYLQLGSVYRAIDKNKDAESIYRQGIAANPKNIALKVELANYFVANERYQEAKTELEQALGLEPTAAAVINNLSAVLLDYFPTQENLVHVKEITTGFERSKNPALLDTRAWMHYRLGDYQTAIDLLETALRQGGGGTEYWYHLGMAYYKNKQSSRAKIYLEKALTDKNKSFTGRDEAVKTYRNL